LKLAIYFSFLLSSCTFSGIGVLTTSEMTIPRIHALTKKKNKLAIQRPGTNVDLPRNSS
jgi:hypothetical protein